MALDISSVRYRVIERTSRRIPRARARAHRINPALRLFRDTRGSARDDGTRCAFDNSARYLFTLLLLPVQGNAQQKCARIELNETLFNRQTT